MQFVKTPNVPFILFFKFNYPYKAMDVISLLILLICLGFTLTIR